jgi:hypothetical protein
VSRRRSVWGIYPGIRRDRKAKCQRSRARRGSFDRLRTSSSLRSGCSIEQFSPWVCLQTRLPRPYRGGSPGFVGADRRVRPVREGDAAWRSRADITQRVPGPPLQPQCRQTLTLSRPGLFPLTRRLTYGGDYFSGNRSGAFRRIEETFLSAWSIAANVLIAPEGCKRVSAKPSKCQSGEQQPDHGQVSRSTLLPCLAAPRSPCSAAGCDPAKRRCARPPSGGAAPGRGYAGVHTR